MKITAIDVLIICLIAIPLLIGAYMQFMIYWPIYVPILIGYAISVFRKKL